MQYFQVSLIAVNAIGDEITSEEDLKVFEKDNIHKVNQVIKEFMPEGYFSEESDYACRETDAAVFGAVNR